MSNKSVFFQSELDEAVRHFDQKLEFEIAHLLSQKKVTIAVAESVTGGALCKRLTQNLLSSVYVVGGVVCAKPMSFITLTGISAATIKKQGVQGPNVSIEMAKGISLRLKSKMGLSIVGSIQQQDTDVFTGQGFISLCWGDKKKLDSYDFEGAIDFIVNQAVQQALILLKDVLKSKISV